MNRIFTKLLCVALFCGSIFGTAYGQIPDESPIPVIVKFNGPGVDLTIGTSSYGTMVGWGENLTQTVSGTLAWAFTEATDDAPSDSLGCSTFKDDFTGKVALIRRGVCPFSQKAHYAVLAGAVGFIILNDSRDDDAIINMSTGDTLSDIVNIPGIFLNRASTLPTAVIPVMESGEEVVVTFEVSSMSEPEGPYIYSTPQSQIIPLRDIAVSYFNIEDDAVTVELTATITDPDGSVTTSTRTATLESLGSIKAVFDPYVPNKIGTYTIEFSNNLNDEKLSSAFEITEYTFGTDNGQFTPTGTTRSEADFTAANLLFHVGSLVRTGETGPVVTHASFGLANPQALYIPGDDEANTFNIVIYDADNDNDGLNDMDEDKDNVPDIIVFEELTPVATGSYILKGNETPNQLLTLAVGTEDGDPVTLKPNHFYYTVVKYDGAIAGTGVVPAYSSTPINYPDLADATPFFVWNSSDMISQVYDDGTGSVAFVVRTHIDGFVPTGVKEILQPSKVKVMPNLTSDYVNVQFALDKTAKEVQIGVLDFNGRIVEVVKMQNVLNDTHQLNVKNFAAGTYFLSIVTPEGYRAEKFVVVK